MSRADSWPRRWDVSLLAIALGFMGISNAFGMVPPYYAMQEWLALNLGISSEFVVLLLIFGVMNLLLPAAASITAACARSKSDRLQAARLSARDRGRLRARLRAARLRHLVRPLQLSLCWSVLS